MNFGEAFEQVKKGKSMRLPYWKEDVVIKAYIPPAQELGRTNPALYAGIMSAPYLYVESRFGKVPWKETYIELFSDDWEVVE